MQGDTLQHYEQRQYNFKPALKELPQIMLPTDLTLKGIVSLDVSNLADTDPFMPSKGGFTKNLPMIPEPKMIDDQDPNNNEPNLNNQQSIKNTTNSNAPTTYSPGNMVTFNTFNRGPAPVYRPPENNNVANNNQNNNASVNNNAPPPPMINLNNNTVVNVGAPPPPPLLNLNLTKTAGPPPPPPLINNLASLGVKVESSEVKEEQKPKAATGEVGRGFNFLIILIDFFLFRFFSILISLIFSIFS